MKKAILAAVAVTILSAPVIFAQNPGGPRTPPTPAQIVSNQVARLTALLDLNTAQQAQATTIFTTEQNSLSGVRSGMQTAHSDLKTAIQSNNASGITAAAVQIGNLTTQQVEAEATAQAAFIAILNPSQLSKYNTLHGPGGFGGPGPGGPHFHGGPR